MQAIKQQKQFPRFAKDFIGIGHHLADKRKQRRKAEQEQRLMANRVIYLQNQQFRAQKSLQKKKVELSNILKKSQRQSIQRQLKQKMLEERQKDIEMARQQNRLKRLLHRQSLDYGNHLISSRNSLDYQLGRSKLQEGQERKRMQMLDNLTNKKERYMTLNMKKQEGRSRIDKFFKDKNKQHTKLYKQKIYNQQSTTIQKFNTIKKLGQIEEALRKKLDQSSLKVSLMQNLIGNYSSRIRRNSLSRTSLNNAEEQNNNTAQISTLQEGIILNNGSNKSLVKNTSNSSLNSLRQILGNQKAGKISNRRSKDKNRFSQYKGF